MPHSTQGTTGQPRSGQQGRPNASASGSSQPGEQAQQTAPVAQAPNGGADGGSRASAEDPQVTKAQIQQLLKEVSGELKVLQAQLSASDQPHPEAGTATDAQLYGAADSLEPSGGSGGTLPIQLQADHATATQSPRRGGGVGRPSADVSHAAPSMTPEEAQLSSTPREDASQARQPVPPEYQGAFDRLHQQEVSSATQ